MNEGYEKNKVGAWSYHIQVLTGGNSGETIIVEAFIVGQLGVHEAVSDSWYHAVTHVKSGCLVGLFSSGMMAVDFAGKACELIDFDAYVKAIVKDGKQAARKVYAAQLAAVRGLRNSYGDPTRFNDTHATVSRKLLIKHAVTS